MNPIAIFYHCLFFIDGKPLAAAPGIVAEQMNALAMTGLLDAAQFMLVGVNGGDESVDLVEKLIPKKAQVVYHGQQCRNEVRTVIELEKWLPGHSDWLVFYFHSRGASHPPGDDFTTTWRRCMMKHDVFNWRTCVKDLETYEAVGCHWMEPPATPVGQYIFAGTFYWARASFLLTLPSILDRDRIKVSGIDAHESRYEAEVWLGNGPRPPKWKDYHGDGHWNPSKIGTCK